MAANLGFSAGVSTAATTLPLPAALRLRLPVFGAPKNPAPKIMAGKAPESADLMDLYLKTHPGPRKVIVHDMEATDDPTHGQQQLSFFHGYYEEHMYHPVLVFDGAPAFLWRWFCAPGNTLASHGALAALKRLIKKLKKA